MHKYVMNEKKEQHDTNKTRILIIDDHVILREGLTQLINEQPDLVVCAEAESVNQALRAIEDQQVDLVVMDISLQGMTDVQLVEKIKLSRPNLPILILSIHDEFLYVRLAFRAGAKGYVVKQEAAEKIIPAIHQVLSRKIYISEKMAQEFTKKMIFDNNISLYFTDCSQRY